MMEMEREMASKSQQKPNRAPQDDPRFARVVEAFAEERDVSRDKRKGFGSGALKVGGRIFAMMSSKGEFVVKLPTERVADLVGFGTGRAFDPGHGRVMKEWIVVTTAEAQWIDLAREACRFVKGHKKRP
jgi:hypothetical protein